MRTVFSLLCVLVCCACFADAPASAALMDSAQKELAAARAEYEKILEKVGRRKDAARAEYEKVCAESDEVLKKIAQARRESARLENLALAAEADKAVLAELSLALERHFPYEASPAVSAGEIFSAAKKRIGGAYEELKSAAVPRAGSAVSSDGEKLYGSVFRIGALKYFANTTRAGFVDSDGVLYGEKFAPEISAFVSGASAKIPADTSFGALVRSERTRLDIASQIKKGGVWIWPILFLGALSAAVFVAKLVQLLRMDASANPDAAAAQLKYPFCDVAAVVDTDKSENLDAVRSALSGANAKMKSWIPALNITATVSPLLGLLGTVSGIIKTFADLSSAGDGARRISDGIAEALITTEYGLVVAIPALVAAALLSRMASARFAALRDFARRRSTAEN